MAEKKKQLKIDLADNLDEKTLKAFRNIIRAVLDDNEIKLSKHRQALNLFLNRNIKTLPIEACKLVLRVFRKRFTNLFSQV